MNSTLAKVQGLGDFQAVRLVEHLSTRIAQQLESSLTELVAETPTAFLEAGIKLAPTISAEQAAQSLSPMDSVQVAREILRELASKPETVTIVDEALASYRDDKLAALEILSLGAAMSMVIVACTTSFRYAGKKLHIAKEVANPALVNSIGKVFSGVPSPK